MIENLCPVPSESPSARIIAAVAKLADRWSGTYWLPHRIGSTLDERLGIHECPARILARTLCRFHGGPRTIGRQFMILRNAKAFQATLGLSQKRIRNAIATLLKIGFIRRVEETRDAWRYSRAWGKAIREPALYEFAPDILAMLRYMIERKRKPKLSGPVRFTATLAGYNNTQSQNLARETPSSFRKPHLHPTGPSMRPIPPRVDRHVSETVKAEIDRSLAEPQSPLDRALTAMLSGVMRIAGKGVS